MATDRYTIKLTIDGDDKASRDLKKINNELTDLDRNATTAGRGMGALGNAVTAAGLLFAAQQVGQFAADLAKVGAEADKANTVFTQLAGGSNNAAIAMQQLRASTGGIVDDLTLMSGANSLLLTGLAKTTDEAANLTGVAVRLGAAMGQDAKASIENFNAALLNNSYQRLDTLGISAANVRERVNELKEAGLDMSEAFAQATLEQGQIALERLGDAAYAGETAVNRVATAMENARIAAGGYASTVAEVGAQLAILTNISLGGDGFGTIAQDIQALREATDELFQTGWLNPGVRQGLIDDAVTIATTFPDDFADIVSRLEAQPLSRQDDAQAIASRFGYDNASMSEFAIVEDALFAVADAQAALTQEAQNTADAVDAQASSYSNVIRSYSAGLITSQAEVAGDGLRNLIEIGQTALRDGLLHQEDLMFNAQRDQLSALSGLASEGSFRVGDNGFFNPAALDEVLQTADELQDRAEQIAGFAELTDFEIVSRDEVQNAQDLADQAAIIADNARAAAEAFENASLSQLLGQGDGGSLGELFNLVLGNVSEDNQDAASQAFGLADGSITTESIALENEIAPLLAAIVDELGVGAGTEATSRAQQALVDGRVEGLAGQDLVDAIAQAIGYELSGEGVGASTTVQAGEGLLAVANRLGITLEEVRAIVGNNTIHPGQEISTGGGQMLVPLTGNDPNFFNGVNPVTSGDPYAPFNTPDNFTGDASVETVEDKMLDASEDIKTTVEDVTDSLTDLGMAFDELGARVRGGSRSDTNGAQPGGTPYNYDTGNPELWANWMPPATNPTTDGFYSAYSPYSSPLAPTNPTTDGFYSAYTPFESEGDGGASGKFTSEDVDNTSIVRDLLLEMSEIDTSTAVDEFNNDLLTAHTEADSIVGRLESINSLDLEAEVPLKLMLDNQTGLSLKPIVAEQIQIILRDAGISVKNIQQ